MDIRFILSAIALFVFLGWLIPSPFSWFKRRALQKRHDAEIHALRTHLHTRMEIDAAGVRHLKAENERLKQIVQNLRFTNRMLGNKPDQAELRLLRVYDRAIAIMERKFPVLIPTWRAMVAHAEMEMKQADQGLTALVRRVFRLAGQFRELPPAGADKIKLLSADGPAASEGHITTVGCTILD